MRSHGNSNTTAIKVEIFKVIYINQINFARSKCKTLKPQRKLTAKINKEHEEGAAVTTVEAKLK